MTMQVLGNMLGTIGNTIGNLTGLTGGTKVSPETKLPAQSDIGNGKPPAKSSSDRFKSNLEKFNKLTEKASSLASKAGSKAAKAFDDLALAGNKVSNAADFGKKPALGALAGLGAGLGMNPPAMAGMGPASMGGAPLGVANANAALSADSVSSTAAMQDVSMGQMGQIMQLQMKSQTEMALMKAVTDMNGAMAKEIKKTGDGVKNMAG